MQLFFYESIVGHVMSRSSYITFLLIPSHKSNVKDIKSPYFCKSCISIFLSLWNNQRNQNKECFYLLELALVENNPAWILWNVCCLLCFATTQHRLLPWPFLHGIFLLNRSVCLSVLEVPKRRCLSLTNNSMFDRTFLIMLIEVGSFSIPFGILISSGNIIYCLDSWFPSTRQPMETNLKYSQYFVVCLNFCLRLVLTRVLH